MAIGFAGFLLSVDCSQKHLTYPPPTHFGGVGFRNLPTYPNTFASSKVRFHTATQSSKAGSYESES